MAEAKTKQTDESVAQFLDAIADEGRRADCHTVAKMMEQATGELARMWGTSIVGFGCQHYKYESGREGDTLLAGFSPRKQNLVLYLTSGFDGYDALLKKMGKHKRGKSCLYLNKLADIDLPTLKQLIEQSVKHTSQMNKTGCD